MKVRKTKKKNGSKLKPKITTNPETDRLIAESNSVIHDASWAKEQKKYLKKLNRKK